MATIYAYWGSNQIAQRRLVKIGYTAQDLGAYLRNLERAFDPILLATRPGGRHEEKMEHAKWHVHLAEGREWFYPVPNLLDYLRREWRVTPTFEELAATILRNIP